MSICKLLQEVLLYAFRSSRFKILQQHVYPTAHFNVFLMQHHPIDPPAQLAFPAADHMLGKKQRTVQGGGSGQGSPLLMPPEHSSASCEAVL